GRTAIVTGGNRGLGKELSMLLAGEAKARTIMACRDRRSCEQTAAEIRSQYAGADVTCAFLDLSDLSSVKKFAEERRGARIDLLVHNAGVMAVPDTKTRDGLETTMQVNFFAPLLLSALLADSMKRS
ncbi:hypothetical protein GUITHDRAFT_40048, partial [Guillardia theta CCMP2712]